MMCDPHSHCLPATGHIRSQHRHRLFPDECTPEARVCFWFPSLLGEGVRGRGPSNNDHGGRRGISLAPDRQLPDAQHTHPPREAVAPSSLSRDRTTSSRMRGSAMAVSGSSVIILQRMSGSETIIRISSSPKMSDCPTHCCSGAGPPSGVSIRIVRRNVAGRVSYRGSSPAN